MSTLEEYAAQTGQDASDPLTRRAWEQLQRESRRGKHRSACDGYNERQVDRIEDALRFVWNAWAKAEGRDQPYAAVFGSSADMIHYLCSMGEPVKMAPREVQDTIRRVLGIDD